MLSLIGKLHPLLVHLPIGILLLNVGLIFITRHEKYAGAKSILPITLLLGAISAIAACVTGLFLSQNGDYNITTLNWHKWLGISITAGSLAIYFFEQHENRFAGIVLAIFLTITGHFGGTLTHGENYLTLSSPNSAQGEERVHFSGDVQKVLIYKDLVQPILQEKCVSCHNANKLKGKLRLDAPELILKGGKNGAVVVAGNADESELIKRLLLELNDEHHMPPKGKPQPSEAEIALLKWWITEGCSFDKKVAELSQNEAVKSILINYNNPESKPKVNEFVPTATVARADQHVLDSLQKIGIVALPIASKSPYLSVNFISLPDAGDSLIQQLRPIGKQIAWLKLSNAPISNNALQTIAAMPNLTRLSLNDTPVSDEGIKYLVNIKQLRYLNLVGTQVSTLGLASLKQLSQLQQLYLFRTKVTSADSVQIQNWFPKAQLDFGNYQVANLASDTTILKK